jgi:hypothetical protein
LHRGGDCADDRRHEPNPCLGAPRIAGRFGQRLFWHWRHHHRPGPCPALRPARREFLALIGPNRPVSLGAYGEGQANTVA